MREKSRIPFEELALNADEVGQLLGCTGRQVLERIACKPGFPRRLSIRPASWIAREVLEWRESHRAGPGTRPRRG
jgi:predicted DNA-binding transcriptional regulator AlpA